MEAANRGAFDAGAPSIGYNITLPKEQQPNPYTTPELTFQFHYFAMRKMHLAMRANALVVFPGGFGTMDELFEILTLEQTRKAPAMPIVLFDQAYWQRVVNFDALIEEDVIEPSRPRAVRIRRHPRGSMAGYSKPRPEGAYAIGVPGSIGAVQGPTVQRAAAARFRTGAPSPRRR